jgi:formyltetrahydrofolate synthetase
VGKYLVENKINIVEKKNKNSAKIYSGKKINLVEKKIKIVVKKIYGRPAYLFPEIYARF